MINGEKKNNEITEEFVIYGQKSDTILVDKAYSYHEKPLSERLQNFMEDGYLKDVMSSNERIMFNDGIVAWINYHISFTKKVENIEGDLRDGFRLCYLLKSLNMNPTLPYINPSLDEKKQNIYYILSYIMEQNDGKGLDSEIKDDWSDQIYNGNSAAIFRALILIAMNLVIQRISDPFHGRVGIDQLEFWLKKEVGMCGDIDHGEVVSSNIEDPDNLVKLAKYLNLKLPFEIDSCLPDSKAKCVLDAIRRETGIPSMLQLDIKLRELEGQDYLWYYFLRYLWVAEVYNTNITIKSAENSAKGNSIPGIRPKDIILQAVESSFQLEQNIENLEQKCHLLYDWIQEKMDCFKKEIIALDTSSGISTRNITLLTQFYKILKDEQTQFNKVKLGCYKLHCNIQRSLKTEGKQHMEYHPSHNIYKVEEQWNRLVELERRLGLKIQEYISHAENRKELYSQWKREISNVKQWMKRWQDYFIMVQESLARLTSAELRKCLKTFKQRFLGEVQEQNHTEQCRLLSTLLAEFSEDTTEKERILHETSQISDEYEVFVKDAQDVAENIRNQQEESTSLDVMYNEQADLLEKLDIQIHELYEYYTLRPVLHSLASCDKFSGYVKDTWDTLFQLSYEMDAALSLEKDIEELKIELRNSSRNYLTNLTSKHMLQRWEGLLLELKSLEDYILQQRVVAANNDKTVHSFEYEMYKAVTLLSTEMVQITRSLTEEGVAHAELLRKQSEELDAKSHIEAPKKEIETVNYHKTKMLRNELYSTFEKTTESIEASAEQLPNQKLSDAAFEKILSLRECSANCFATIDMVLTDSEICNNYIFEKELTRSDLVLYQHELDSCKRAAQLLPAMETVAAMFYRKHKKHRADCLAQDLKRSVETVDPLHHRVTLSAWLNFRRLDVYTELDNIESELAHSFHVVSGNHSYVTERDLKEHLDPSLLKFFKKRATEYLGGDYNGEDTAFDYRRLVSNLVGKHCKLLIEPDPHAMH